MPDQTVAAPDELTHERARELFTQAYDVMNEHDPGKLGSVFTEDVVFEDDAWPQTVRGLGDMKRFLGAVWRAFPDFRFELLEGPFLTEDGRRAAAHVRVEGTMDGPMDPPGFAPTGKRISADYGGFYSFEGERIRHGRIIINMSDLAVQLGALPAPGSRGERAAVVAQRLQARLKR